MPDCIKLLEQITHDDLMKRLAVGVDSTTAPVCVYMRGRRLPSQFLSSFISRGDVLQQPASPTNERRRFARPSDRQVGHLVVASIAAFGAADYWLHEFTNWCLCDSAEQSRMFFHAALTILFMGVVLWPVVVHLRRRSHATEVELQRIYTAAREAEADLRALKAALDQHTIVVVTDRNGTIIEVNDRFCNVSQYSREELLGSNHRMVNSGLHPRRFWRQMWRTISNGHAWHGEICNRAKDGTLHWLDSVIMPIHANDGRIVRYLTIRTEITSRKTAERRLVESEQLLRTIIDVLPQRVFWKDCESRYLGCNKGFIDDSGTAEIVGKSDFDMPWTDQEAAFYRECDQRVLQSGIAELNICESLRTAAGEEFILQTNKVPLRDSTGQIIGIVGTYQDITHIKQAESRLASERAVLAAFVEHAPAAILMMDRDLRIITASRRWLEEFAPPGVPVISKLHDDVYGYIPQDWRDGVRRCLTGVVEHRENERWRPPFRETDQYIRWEARPWHDAAGEIGGVILLAVDITEQQTREIELARLRDAAEISNRSKSEFLANMSHEIRTPLTAILGYAELLRELEDPTSEVGMTKIELIETIRRAGEHLLSVVNDILDLSRIEAGAMPVECVDMDLAAVFQAADSLLRPRASDKGIQLEFVFETPLPRRIVGDQTRLRQVILNLAGNAVKFTDVGHVRIIAGVVNEGENAMLRIDFEDTGPGLTDDEITRLFRPFSQADNSATRRHGGCGLGLVISRRLAGMLGGSVQVVRSEVGVGSLFRLVIRLKPIGKETFTNLVDAKSSIIGSMSKVTLQGRILLAEDGPDNQKLIALMLRRAGAEVDVADNGRIALKRIEASLSESSSIPRYDILLTDMQMPEMDGYTLSKTLRERGITIPIIALTAHAMAGDSQRCIDAGCDDYASKPIDRDKLLTVCAYWMNMRRDPAPRRVTANVVE